MITKDRLFIATMAEDAYKQITENDTGVEIDNFADPGISTGKKHLQYLMLSEKRTFSAVHRKNGSFILRSPSSIRLQLIMRRWSWRIRAGAEISNWRACAESAGW